MSDDYKDRARRRAKERQETYWWKVVGTPNGTDNTFRILPTPKKGTSSPAVFFEYQVHRDVGPKKRMVRCGKDADTGEGRCWLCDKRIPALEKAGKQSRAVGLAPQTQLIVQVAVLGDNGKLEGPFGWNPSKKVGNDIIGSVLGSKRKDYVDAKKGYNLTINRTGTGMMDTRYGMIEPDEDPSVVPAEIMKKLKPFCEVKEIPVYGEDIQKAAYEGRDLDKAASVDDDDDDEDEEDSEDTEPEEEEDEEEEVKPMKKGSVKAAVKKSKPAPEPEEDDEEEVDEGEEEDESEAEEDDEEEEAPKKKSSKVAAAAPVKKKAKPAPVEEDDDEDESVEDEEDEPWEDDADADEEPEPDEEEQDEDEEEAAPVKKKSKVAPAPVKAVKKKAAPVEEEDDEEESEDEDEAEEDDEEEEAPPPVKKKKSAPPPPPPSMKKAKKK